MIPQWERPFKLSITGLSDLLLNYTDPVTGRRFQLVPDTCSSTLPVRVTDDDIPQGDGKIPHRRWRSGYGVHLAIEPVIAPPGADTNLVEPYGEATPACDEDLVEMMDLLGLHINAMIRTGLVSGFPNARLIWTPSGQPNRMLDRLQLAGTPTETELGGDLGGTRFEVDFDTPYPYYISELETDTMIPDTGGGFIVTIHNDGNTDYFPVVQAWGPSVYFELINHSIVDTDGQPLRMIYDDSLPGGQPILGTEYVEFVFFTGTAFVNGNQAKRLAGVDFRYSDFFPLIPGDNILELTPGGTDANEFVQILWNHAWA